MNKFYEDLFLEFEEEGYSLADKESKGIYKEQKKNLDDLLAKIGLILIGFSIADEFLNLTNKEKKALNKDFGVFINNLSTKEFKAEKDIMNKVLQDVAESKYYKDAYLMSIGIDFKLNMLTPEQIEKVVNGTIEGKRWSTRLHTNKKKLEKDLKKELKKFLNGDTSVNNITKNIKKKYNMNAYNSKRLIDTEVCRVQAQSNELFAEEHGVMKQIFTATLDKKTSNVCRNLDGQTFDINDKNKPIPPLHPSCRSCLINLPSNDWKPKLRMDNVIKEYVPFQTYKEWAKENNIE